MAIDDFDDSAKSRSGLPARSIVTPRYRSAEQLVAWFHRPGDWAMDYRIPVLHSYLSASTGRVRATINACPETVASAMSSARTLAATKASGFRST